MTPRRPTRRPPAARPALVELEDRTAPAVLHAMGPGGVVEVDVKTLTATTTGLPAVPPFATDFAVQADGSALFVEMKADAGGRPRPHVYRTPAEKGAAPVLVNEEPVSDPRQGSGPSPPPAYADVSPTGKAVVVLPALYPFNPVFPVDMWEYEAGAVVAIDVAGKQVGNTLARTTVTRNGDSVASYTNFGPMSPHRGSDGFVVPAAILSDGRVVFEQTTNTPTIREAEGGGKTGFVRTAGAWTARDFAGGTADAPLSGPITIYDITGPQTGIFKSVDALFAGAGDALVGVTTETSNTDPVTLAYTETTELFWVPPGGKGGSQVLAATVKKNTATEWEVIRSATVVGGKVYYTGNRVRVEAGPGGSSNTVIDPGFLREIDPATRQVRESAQVGWTLLAFGQTGKLRIEGGDRTVGERDKTVTIAVTRTGASAGRVTVRYATADGSATAGSDYEATDGILTWEDGDTAPKTITVPVRRDQLIEPTETFTLRLSDPTGGADLIDPTGVTVTITDGPGVVRLAAAGATVVEGGRARLVVERAEGAGGRVAVRFSTTDGTARAGDDYTPASGTLVWDDGDSAPRAVEIPVADDRLTEPLEAFVFGLSDPAGGAELGPAAAAVTITDNDVVVDAIRFDPPEYRVSEGERTVTLTVVREGTSIEPLRVSFATRPGTAGPDDFGSAAGLLNWGPGEFGRRDIVIPILDDTSREPTERFTVAVAGRVLGADVLLEATVDITDDDAEPPPPPPPPPRGMAVRVGFPQFAVGAGPNVQFYNADRSVRATVTPFPGFTSDVRTAAADLNADGIADLVAATGPGAATRVRVLDGKDQRELFALDPFEAAFTGGVYVAAGDVTGDGVADLIITPDEGGGPRVRVFNGAGFSQLLDFFGIDDPNFRGGARAAAGDVTGDGTADLIVAAGFQGGPRVAGFDGRTLSSGRPARLFGDFFAFEQSLRNGVFVAAGDLDGDGFAEVIAGGGPGGGPRVTAFSGKALLGNALEVRANFFGGDPTDRGGVRVAVKDLDADARADLVVGTDSRVTAYLGKNIPADGTPAAAFDFDAAGSAGGVFVG